MLKLVLLVLSTLNMTYNCCPPVGCDLMTFSTVRPDTCECNDNCTTDYVYPVGFSLINMTYNYTRPVAQDFYQNGELIASCPENLYCSKMVALDPDYPLFTNVTTHAFMADYEHSMLFLTEDDQEEEDQDQ